MHAHRIGIIWILAALVAGPAVGAQSPPPLADILEAHQAWPVAPATIEITGIATRGDVSGPIRITATRNGEVSTEFDGSRRVDTNRRRFSEDGSGGVTPGPTPGGFAQLDVTGPFFLAHMAGRDSAVEPLAGGLLDGRPVRRVRISTGRTETHYRHMRVRDEAELYLDESGLLIGISRSFYDEFPPFDFTMALAFSDYRDTGGVQLPYRIERYVKGAEVETIEVTSYIFDVPADAAFFSPGGAR